MVGPPFKDHRMNSAASLAAWYGSRSIWNSRLSELERLEQHTGRTRAGGCVGGGEAYEKWTDRLQDTHTQTHAKERRQADSRQQECDTETPAQIISLMKYIQIQTHLDTHSSETHALWCRDRQIELQRLRLSHTADAANRHQIRAGCCRMRGYWSKVKWAVDTTAY